LAPSRWSSTLKPSYEPIIVARKPFSGTLAENVIEHGTGAFNIKGCRIGDEVITTVGTPAAGSVFSMRRGTDQPKAHIGRWPANTITTDIDESWAEYFYQAKPSKAERGLGNTHPTVKPIDLMEHLVKLVTPPGGTVLDCFMGSGTTGIAAMRAGFDFIGCELSPEFAEIARVRIESEDRARAA
jgi:hypothetical protein